MNQPLADVAVNAITDPAYPDGKGWCQRWVRLVVEAVYGTRFAGYAAGSARKSALLWRGTAFDVTGQDPQPGDILYKLGLPLSAGHVGIYVGGGRVAENSSTSRGRVRGACGYRTLEQYGSWQVQVRLPAPVAPVKPEVVLGDGRRLPVTMKGDAAWVDAVALAQAIGGACPLRATAEAWGKRVEGWPEIRVTTPP